MNTTQIIAVFLSFLLFNSAMLYSQHDEHNHNHDADIHHHEHKNEISLAGGAVFIPLEGENAAGFHTHYIKGIGSNHRFGVGAGLGLIVAGHKHYSLSVVTHCRVYKGLAFGYSPGVVFVSEGGNSDIFFANHFELGYEIELGEMYFGPMVEVGLANGTAHYMAGIQIGMDF